MSPTTAESQERDKYGGKSLGKEKETQKKLGETLTRKLLINNRNLKVA